MDYIQDPYFTIQAISKVPDPGRVSYYAMHQDYSAHLVVEQPITLPDERCQEIVIDRCLKFGHWGVIEHPQIIINAGYFPHSVMQQLRTHRHISMDVQSFRYTGQCIADIGSDMADHFASIRPFDLGDPVHQLGKDLIQDTLPISDLDERIEKVFYLRPVGFYTDRKGAKYEYTQTWRDDHKAWITQAVIRYAHDIALGMAEEHARGLIPFDVRQHFVMSCNVRSLMHILDLRYKRDAQIEIQTFCHHLLQIFREWCPVFAEFYEKERATKARLAP